MRAEAVLLALLAPSALAQCDVEYECEFRSGALFGSFYDLRPMCTPGMPYVFTNTSTNTTYNWMVCGNSQTECIPPYDVQYNRGTAIQFFGSDPANGSTCTKRDGTTAACTKDCYVLGTGVPFITLIDPNRPSGGVNVTHVGVAPVGNDPFPCPKSPITNEVIPRSVTIQVQCNQSYVLRPVTIAAYEQSTCNYLIVMQSKYGCGCVPYCGNRNCGSDGCGGFCGPQGHGGQCPSGNTCTSIGQCCRPDCRNRQCGSDGCGGVCGGSFACPVGYNCTRYQQCVASSGAFAPSPLPSLLPSSTIYTTTGGDYFAAYMGGTLTAGVIALAVMFYMRARAEYTRL